MGMNSLACSEERTVGFEDFETSLESQPLAEIGSIFDLLRGYGDIQSDLMPSDIIRVSEDIGARMAALRSAGIVCLAGEYVERLTSGNKPAELFSWRFVVIKFGSSTNSQILEEKNGKRFMIAIVPAGNREFRF